MIQTEDTPVSSFFQGLLVTLTLGETVGVLVKLSSITSEAVPSVLAIDMFNVQLVTVRLNRIITR